MTNKNTDKTVNKTDNSKPWQFEKGKSGNPNGRPKGTSNKASIIARELLQDNSEELIQKAIDLALEGDLTALKLCLDRICPTLKSQTKEIEFNFNADDNLTQTAQAILQYVSNGQIAPDIGLQIVSSISVIVKTEEIEKLKQRLEALEISMMKVK